QGIGDGVGVLHERFCLSRRYDDWCGNGADLIPLRIDDLLGQREMHYCVAVVGDLTVEGCLSGFSRYLRRCPVDLRYVNGVRDNEGDPSVDTTIKGIVGFEGGRRYQIVKVIVFDGDHIVSNKAWMHFKGEGCVAPFVAA